MTSLEREGLPLSARRPRPLPPSGRAAQYHGVKGQCGVWVGSWGRVGAAGGMGMTDPSQGTSNLGGGTKGLCFPLLCITLIPNCAN